MVMWFERGHRGLAVVGPTEDVGCSYVAGNLAVVFSQIGARTLLIDANMRTPRLDSMFGLGDRLGLSDALVHRVEIEQAIVPEVVPGLSLLTAGTVPPNPQELLNRLSFGEMQEYVENTFDIILYDTPPGNESSDAQVIAGRVGGVMMVAREDRSHMRDVAAFSDILMSCGTQIVGSVLNEV